MGQHTNDAFIPIRGAESCSQAEVARLLRGNHRAVQFECCVSLLVATFRYRTSTYLVDSDSARFRHGLAFSLIALAFGPWGVPWGPIHTARAVWSNLHGGVDVTEQLLAYLDGRELPRPPEPVGVDR